MSLHNGILKSVKLKRTSFNLEFVNTLFLNVKPAAQKKTNIMANKNFNPFKICPKLSKSNILKNIGITRQYKGRAIR